jgi:hypothetical protein
VFFEKNKTKKLLISNPRFLGNMTSEMTQSPGLNYFFLLFPFASRENKNRCDESVQIKEQESLEKVPGRT